ncbi:hypothetical protein ACJ2A9_20205 [Anaerobacillus sp. MEB173]|uniref:hypothetical protein n=1 Tax=Anaerobacillus sp. MEB173 TaxID=3383345 RepID=UPI003F8F1A69
MSIFTDEIIEQIYLDTKNSVNDVVINKIELKQEILMFDSAMQHVKDHPWRETKVTKAIKDTTSRLYKNIHKSFVGPDPEEDYKDVIVWSVADKLYVTAAIDHNPDLSVKWDVVVYDQEQEI